MSEIVTTESSSDTNVIFTWTPPATNGDAITSFTILLFKKSTATYVSNTTLCSGTNPSILTCSVSMADLITHQGYVAGDLIKAKVQATNTIGTSVESDANTAGILT